MGWLGFSGVIFCVGVGHSRLLPLSERLELDRVDIHVEVAFRRFPMLECSLLSFPKLIHSSTEFVIKTLGTAHVNDMRCRQ
jgi:hypothetical protein